jgi:hypothetical protein
MALYFSYGKVLGVFAFEVLEIHLDVAHLSLDVTVGDDGLGTFYEFPLIVDTI